MLVVLAVLSLGSPKKKEKKAVLSWDKMIPLFSLTRLCFFNDGK
jgi:hypothetical protein